MSVFTIFSERLRKIGDAELIGITVVIIGVVLAFSSTPVLGEVILFIVEAILCIALFLKASLSKVEQVVTGIAALTNILYCAFSGYLAVWTARAVAEYPYSPSYPDLEYWSDIFNSLFVFRPIAYGAILIGTAFLALGFYRVRLQACPAVLSGAFLASWLGLFLGYSIAGGLTFDRGFWLLWNATTGWFIKNNALVSVVLYFPATALGSLIRQFYLKRKIPL